MLLAEDYAPLARVRISQEEETGLEEASDRDRSTVPWIRCLCIAALISRRTSRGVFSCSIRNAFLGLQRVCPEILSSGPASTSGNSLNLSRTRRL
jgi:hypothetical protein